MSWLPSTAAQGPGRLVEKAQGQLVLGREARLGRVADLEVQRRLAQRVQVALDEAKALWGDRSRVKVAQAVHRPLPVAFAKAQSCVLTGSLTLPSSSAALTLTSYSFSSSGSGCSISPLMESSRCV